MKNYDSYKLDTPDYLNSEDYQLRIKIYCNSEDISDKLWNDLQDIVNQYNRVVLSEDSKQGYFIIDLRSDTESYIEALESDLRGYLNNYCVVYEVENG